MVAGINLAIFANTRHKEAALKFVQFMTSDTEQTTLNKAYSSLPTVQGAYGDPAFQTDTVAVLKQSWPPPRPPTSGAGGEPVRDPRRTLMKNLFADAAAVTHHLRLREEQTVEASQQVKAAADACRPGRGAAAPWPGSGSRLLRSR